LRFSLIPPFSFQDLRGANGAQKAVKGASQAFGLGLIDETVRFAMVRDESSGFEEREVAGDSGSGDGKSAGDFSGREGAVFEFLQNLTAGGVGKSAEDLSRSFHSFQFSHFAKYKQEETSDKLWFYLRSSAANSFFAE
jgi:hypothetical protein